jgi:hypothetical protein
VSSTYYCGIGNTAGAITTYLGNTNGTGMSGNTVIKSTTAATIYVNMYTNGVGVASISYPSYNVSIVRIA